MPSISCSAPPAAKTEAAAPSTTTTEKVPKRDYQLAHIARTAGNELFKKEQYEAAVAKYTEGIALSPEDNKDCAKYYSNRAACHAKLKQWELVSHAS